MVLFFDAEEVEDHSAIAVAKHVGRTTSRVRPQCEANQVEHPDAISPADTGDHSYFAYILVDDVDNYHDEFKSKDVEIIKKIASEPWKMREFGIRTVDGHRIMFGQELN